MRSTKTAAAAGVRCSAGLGPALPVTRVAARVVDGHHRDLVIINPIDNDVRKAAHTSEPKVLGDLAEQLGCAPDAREDLINASEKRSLSPAR
jgi:hypothetical protein